MGKLSELCIIIEDAENHAEEQLRNASPEVQQDLMEKWFYENYENTDSLSVRAAEGYKIKQLGTSEPIDVLQEKFAGIVPGEEIRILGDALREKCLAWVVIDHDPYPAYMDDLYMSGYPDPYWNFDKGLDNTKNLLSAGVGKVDSNLDANTVDNNTSGLFNRLLFVSVITALEVYLFDTLRQQMGKNDVLARRFVETHSAFKGSIPMSDIYEKMDNIKGIISSHLEKLVWHRLEKAEKIYKEVLHINFPDKKKILRAIEIRHIILHSGGRFDEIKDNDAVTSDGVNKLIEEVREFVSDIEEQKQQFIKQLEKNKRLEEAIKQLNTREDFGDMNDSIPF